MSIDELRRVRQKLETEIMLDTMRKLEAFRAETGMSIKDISISLSRVRRWSLLADATACHYAIERVECEISI